jgi:hypothetical protein
MRSRSFVCAGLLALGGSALVSVGPALTDRRPGLVLVRESRDELPTVELSATIAQAQAQADGPDGLPATWCGDQLASDDSTNAVYGPELAQFKIVYAYPADRPNRFAGWADALQADVAVTGRFLSAQDGGTKSIRFDMGTRCGPQYVDIQTVALPGDSSVYSRNFTAIISAVSAALGPAAGPRNVLTLADGLAGPTVEFGLGETYMGAFGEVPGEANPHNRGGLSSVLFTRDGAAAPDDAPGGWWPDGFLHELTHNLGAVQHGAPHSTEPAGQSDPRYGHCWQGVDVMCYTEDGGASHEMVTDCQPIEGTISQTYDCGRDDYFNPAPPPGSYLATHWNTYDSAFMTACGDVTPACGGGELWVPTPPGFTSPPTVTGSPRRGTLLRAETGVWINQPTGYTYQWQRRASDRWKDIFDATDSSYTSDTEDLGHRLRVTVIAANRDGAVGASSGGTATIEGVGIGRAAHADRTRANPGSRY